ncbi:uncharacterized protein KIAA1143 homolog [Zophobas morio]|uniref:uncharacterized protein KIAA1143 homolog n=1 Tax=Zophobas morio TaxID=2755281 RepID=UPI00308291D1
MSKRNITYTKPEEPEFLKKIKQQAGYKEGPTVATKSEQLGPAEDLDCDEEQPTVVVLNEGDLTAEEAQREKARLERGKSQAPYLLGPRTPEKRPFCAKHHSAD